MRARLMLGIFLGLWSLNLCGCLALLAGGVAGGAGTAAWMSGKLSQEFQADYPATIVAAKKALKALDLPVTKEVHEKSMTQIRSQYPDGREVRIDIHRMGPHLSQVDVRVGTPGDKQAASSLMQRIADYL